MRILMVNVVCGIRSTGRICTDLATTLEEHGHEVKIAYGREEVPEQFRKYAVRIGNDFDVKLHGVRARLLDGCGFGSKSATVKFIEWVKKYDPDIIHLHNIHGYYINIEVLFHYLRSCGKKIIWTLHDCWAFTGHSAYCDAVNCERWETGCHDCPNRMEYPASFTDDSKRNWKKKKVLMDAIPNMTIITPSQWLAGLVKKSFLAQYPVTVIHNGIDTSQFYPLENDFREFYGVGDRFMILGVATTWNEMKGYSDYLKLAERLGDEYRIVLVGMTREQKEKLPKSVLGIERTNSVKELAYIYSAANLFINLSYCENYPTVNLEAIACGTPVLTYRSGGSPESVKTDKGIIVSKGDLDSVEQEIRQYRDANSNKHFEIERDKIDRKNTVNHYLAIMSTGGYWGYKHSLGVVGKKIVLGVAAVWDKRKGLDDLIELSKMLEQHAKTFIIGLSNDHKKQLGENVIVVNETNHVDELRKYYSVADYFVNPTYEDNYPTTNLESISCGTPVITYDTGGSGESARLYGCTVSKGCITDLKNAVCEAYVKQSGSIDKRDMKDRYMELYIGGGD